MKKCVIIGGGASVKEGIDKGLWNKVSSDDVWSINFAYKTMPYLPTREIWIDIHFFNQNIVELQSLAQKGVKMYAKHHNKYADIPKITQLRTTRIPAEYYGTLMPEKNSYFIGRLGQSGFLALSIAIAEKYDEIFLLGYDFGTPSLADKVTHYYQDNIKELKIESSGIKRPECYMLPYNVVKPEVEDFELYLREPQFKIYNVSMNSNIKCFEKISYEQFFNKIS